ncbi:MAG: hypothetical protein RLN63_09445, partial [Miltoncostaeaceae bacterium]
MPAPPRHSSRRRPRWPLLAVAVWLTAVLGMLPGSASGSPALDAVVADLRASGVHVSPRALGEAAPSARAALAEARRDLLAERREVNLVIAPGPIGSPGMTAFARRLYLLVDEERPVIVTAPGRPLAIWGAEPRESVLVALAASGAAREGDPVERLVAAARGAIAPSRAPDGTREVVTLLVLAALGAAWAAAWGAHRTDRARSVGLTEARAELRLWLDALRMQARRADIVHLAPPARHRVGAVMAMCADTLSGLHSARTVADVRSLAPRVRRGFGELRHATAGLTPDLGHAWEGLCALDPVHGAALFEADIPRLGPCAVCRNCRDLAAAGGVPALRLVPRGTGAVPYTSLAADTPGGVLATPGPEVA